MGRKDYRQGNGMDVDLAVLQLRLRARRVLAGVVRRLPVTVADRLRGPVTAPLESRRHRAHDALLHVLRRGGIPAGVTTFTLRDNRELVFVNAESLVLHQLYWFGEQGWEPQLLPWWRRFCRHSSAILELGANVGYFTVQGAKAGPHARYVAVEPYPASARVCRANLELNGVGSVELVTAAAVAHTEPPAVELHVPWDQLATPTVAFIGANSELPERMSRRVVQTTSVPAVDVRSLLPGIDLFKLDVEGQEHALLAASREHLRTRKPTVFVEVLPGTARLRQLIADLCRDEGFHCYMPRADCLVRLGIPDILGAPLLDRYGCQDVILSAEPHLDRWPA
ncbi:MAG TPA: FkbM family methyltransferase [Actinomycetes bacterium]|jgi:FkbM family methyltransferase|nr:FkbM family methyltransferase [Actinomycetes bacterium]